MQIAYNLTGPDRKPLVTKAGEILGVHPVYLRKPTYGYRIGDFNMSYDGVLTGNNEEQFSNLVEQLKAAGFEAQEIAPTVHDEITNSLPADDPAVQAQPETTEPVGDLPFETNETDETVEEDVPGEETTEQSEETDSAEEGNRNQNTFTVSIPRDGCSDAAVENMRKMCSGKAGLIKKAMNADSVDIVPDGDKLEFPWFDRIPDADEVRAYTVFAEKLAKAAMNQKRVTMKEKDVVNEKYAFRTFLLKLGFIGADYKAERKTLLKNLSGSSAFRDGRPVEDNAESMPEADA